MIDIFLSSRLKISFILLTPSSSVHLILIFCFSSSSLLFFSEIFFIASCLSFGIYFEINFSSSFILSMNSGRSLKSSRIFCFISFSFSFRICLNATLIACVCLYFCITSFFSFEVTRLRDRWAWFPLTAKTLQTTFLFGTTYCRINLIRPGAISDEIIVPSWPFGISTNVIVFVTSLTVHNIRSSSCIELSIIWVFKSWLVYKTSSTLERIFALPLDGSASIVLHSRHLTFVDALPKIVCEFLHLEQFTFMNFPLFFI